jgi:hypothetical protein
MFINTNNKVSITTVEGNKYDGIINHIVLQPEEPNNYETVIFVKELEKK